MDEQTNGRANPKAEFKRVVTKLLGHISAKDLGIILSPPALSLEVLKGTLDGADLSQGDFDPAFPERELLDAILDFTRWLSTYYLQTNFEGIENIPKGQPVLLVGNHSGGLVPIDALFVMDEIRATFNEERLVQPLLHDYAYLSKTTAKHAKRMGLMRASRENTLAALEAGRDVMVYPGGDKEAFRTFRDRNKIMLSGRKGFIRVAMKAKVPIIPVVSVGLHESFIILTTGEKWAEKLGLKNFLRTEMMPIGFSFPWGLAPQFFPFIPLPTPVDIRLLSPVELKGDPEDEEAVQRGYDTVSEVMQRAMDDLASDRLPFLGRPRRRTIPPEPHR